MELYLSGPKETAYLADMERSLIWRQNMIKYLNKILSCRSDLTIAVSVDDKVTQSILNELAIKYKKLYFLDENEFVVYTKIYEYPEFTSDCEQFLDNASKAVNKTVRRDNMDVYRQDVADLMHKRISYRIGKYIDSVNLIIQFNVPHNNLIRLSDISKLNKLVGIIDITQDIPAYYVGDISVGSDIFYQYLEVYNGE